jgi:excinuclease ABC subunit B
MQQFKLKAEYSPAGDQPKAIELLTKGVDAGLEHQTLLGVTGSGKTYTIANVIANTQKPTLVLAHNKTLAAQLFAEFKEFFPENSVNYFVSYYDYYQPEAYVASRDLYIEKETNINEDIERYRNAATQSALTRKDIIIVASVSCIYGLGNPDDYTTLARELKVGESYPMSKFFSHLTDMQYYRSEYDFYPGLFRVRGDTVDINLVAEETALRIQYFGDEIESIKTINTISGEVMKNHTSYMVFPAKQYVTPFERVKNVVPQIREDLAKEKASFLEQGKILEATRLEQRVNYDIEMLQEVGFVSGIENYSRYIDGRPPGTAPSTLLDYMPKDWLLVVDESHMTIPQIGGMFNGDQARKQMLVDYGFRLKAAMDNRPLKFDEFKGKVNQTIYVSATPSDYELKLSREAVMKSKKNIDPHHKGIIEQIIRPTGLLDPSITIRPTLGDHKQKLLDSLKENELVSEYDELSALSEVGNQIDDLIEEIQKTIKKGQRVLVTTLTKKMAEELSSYLEELNIKVQYIHSDVDAIKRVEILRDLRLGTFDVLVGINLLREGLDLPEVSLVGILDADKEGFLRSETSFIQVIGRAARHSEGRVIMYADRVTGSMLRAIQETKRRHAIQHKYNLDHGITPTTIFSKIKNQLEKQEKAEMEKEDENKDRTDKLMELYPSLNKKEKKRAKEDLIVKMEIYADSMEFEKAAKIRDFLVAEGHL